MEKKTANIKFIITILTSALLFYLAYLISTVNVQGTIEPYWNRFYIHDLNNSIIYTQLTIITIAFLGITQIIAAKTTQKSTYATKHPKLNKTFVIFQKLSGTAYVTLALISYPLPFMILTIGFLPLSLLFLTTQTLSGIIFIHTRKVTKNSEQTISTNPVDSS